MTVSENPSKAENQSPSFSTFNHNGQLQRRVVDEITPTQTTKPGPQKIASSPAFCCRSPSLSMFSLLSFCILFTPLSSAVVFSPAWSNTLWCHPLTYKGSLGTILQYSNTHKNTVSSRNSVSDDSTIGKLCNVLTQLSFNKEQLARKTINTV